MAALNETRNALHAVSGGVTAQGLLLQTGGSGLIICANVQHQPCGVSAAESSRDAAGALENAGGTVAVYPMSGIVYVKCEAIAAADADFGIPLYNGATDGHVSSSSSGSAKQIGHLFSHGVEIAAGDLVPMSCIGVGV